MELEELRQRLLLRSKSADIPPIAHPVQVSDVALSAAASKLKWETTVSPAEIAARLRNNVPRPEASEAKLANGNAALADAPGAPRRAADEELALEAAPAGAPSASAVTTPVAAAQPISLLADSVNLLAEPTAALREHFAQLNQLQEPIDTATQSTDQALKRIAGLFENLASLANNLQSVKAFAEQVKTLSASFEPMKGLNAQLEQVMAALCAQVKEVGAALAPVKTFNGKVRQLSSALDSIELLEGQISALAEVFRPAAETFVEPQSAPQGQKPTPVAQAA